MQQSKVRARATRDEMEERAEFLIAYASKHGPVTVRQLYYRAEIRGLSGIGKDESGYVKIQRQVLALRRAKRLPYNTIADATRWMRKPTTYNSIQDALEEAARLYRKALWYDSEVEVEVWCEKDALAGVLYPVTARYDVPLMPTEALVGTAGRASPWRSPSAKRRPARSRATATDSPLYRRVLTPFLNRSGLAFVNKDDRVALRKMLPIWDEIDQWRAELTSHERGKLNNPREVLAAFQEASKPGTEPSHKPLGNPRHDKLQRPTDEQTVMALYQQIEMLEEQMAAAERQSAYFGTLVIEVARRAHLSEEQLAELRTQVRAELAGETAEDDDE